MTHGFFRGTRPHEHRPKYDSANWHDASTTGIAVTVDGQSERDRPWLTCSVEEFYKHMDKLHGPQWREGHTL